MCIYIVHCPCPCPCPCPYTLDPRSGLPRWTRWDATLLTVTPSCSFGSETVDARLKKSMHFLVLSIDLGAMLWRDSCVELHVERSVNHRMLAAPPELFKQREYGRGSSNLSPTCGPTCQWQCPSILKLEELLPREYGISKRRRVVLHLAGLGVFGSTD